MLSNTNFGDHQLAVVLEGNTVIDATDNLKQYCGSGSPLSTHSAGVFDKLIGLALKSRKPPNQGISGFETNDGAYHGHWIRMDGRDLLVVESRRRTSIHDYLLVEREMTENPGDFFSVLPSFDLPSLRLNYVELLVNTADRLKHVSLEEVFSAPYNHAFQDTVLKHSFSEGIKLHKNLISQLGATLPVAINVSTYQLEDPNLLHRLLDLTAKELGSIGNHFMIELVEHYKPKSINNLRKGIDSIRELGVCVALDDFSHGHAGLDWISHLKFDQVKFDMRVTQSLISNADNSQGFMDTFKRWAADDDFTMAAEGIESSRQLELVGAFGFKSAQGFLLSGKKPMKDFPSCLRNTPV